MMNVIPWLELSSVLGLVLVVVAAYEFIVVRPLRRRVVELADRGDVLDRSIHGVTGLSVRLLTTDRTITEQLRQLGERLGQVELRSNSRPYEQAISLAERGERAERLVSCFGLAEAEANLISLLHGAGSRDRASQARIHNGGTPLR